MRLSSVRILSLICWGAILLPRGVQAGESGEAALEITSPKPYQVIQREGFDPRTAHANNPGGPTLGFANVTLAGKCPVSPDKLSLQVRSFPFSATADEKGKVPWVPLDAEIKDGSFSAKLHLPAGGWYRIELRADEGDKTIARGEVSPVGVGEVFIVAGQSYASNSNDEQLQINEPQGRIAAYDMNKGTWQFANDPQPTSDNSDGGSIWPAFGDLLVPVLRVPVGLANVSYGGTSSRQWLPGEGLHDRLIKAGNQIGPFRAVLWQQGESDVIEKTSTDKYVSNLRTIRETAARQWGFDPPWLLAKSTLHPTVYVEPEGEGRIRAAIDELCKLPGFRPGPDTDILSGAARGGIGTRRHFSGEGQKLAALLWFSAVWEEIQEHPQAIP